MLLNDKVSKNRNERNPAAEEYCEKLYVFARKSIYLAGVGTGI
jgi:hypothetical protein